MFKQTNNKWFAALGLCLGFSVFSASAQVPGLTSVDINDPAAPTDPGSTEALPDGGIRLTGSGFAVFDVAGDIMHFAYEEITGDFDKKVRVTAIDADNNWGRGGIMARESLDNFSPGFKALVAGRNSNLNADGNPQGANQVRMAARFSSEANWSTISRAYGGVADTLPNQWVRLQRVSTYFAMYVGTDGENWTLVGEKYTNGLVPDTLLVGLYASGADDGFTGVGKTTIDYADYSDVELNDSTAPTLVSAGTLDKKVIGVKFSELLDADSVQASDFQVSGASVTDATVGIGGASVYLTVTGLTADSFTVSAGGISDVAGNEIAAGASVEGNAASGWQTSDIGVFLDPDNRPNIDDDPYVVSQQVATSVDGLMEVEIVGGGSNIWNPGDFLHFLHTEKSGDFDVQVEVVRWDRSLDTASYGHAGLQVRPSLYLAGQENTIEGTQVPNVMNTTYGEGNQERTAITIWRDAENGGYGNSPVIGTGTADSNGVIGRFGRLRAGNSAGDPVEGSSAEASRWLRLKREGDEFISYWSYDGVEWVEHNRHTLALPADVLVGFAGMTDTNGKQPWHYNTIHIRNFGDFGAGGGGGGDPLEGLTSVDINDPAAPTDPGSTEALPDGGIRMSGSGFAAFDPAGDIMHFTYQEITGDFDKKVRVAAIDANNNWGRGGIMARESLDNFSPGLKALVAGRNSTNNADGNPQGANQVRFVGRFSSEANWSTMSRAYGGVAEALPNQWVRLQRVGDYFAMYVGSDGENWTLVGEKYTNGLIPETLLVGLYATGADDGLVGAGSATIDYYDFSDAMVSDSEAPTVVSAGTLDKQVIGVKFSEILDADSVDASDFAVEGATVSSVEVGIGGASVYLTVSGLTADSFTVTVNGVTDVAGNAVAADSTVTGNAASGWQTTDIGVFLDPDNRPNIDDDPYVIGKQVATSVDGKMEVEIVGGGSNIWNPGDFLHFLHTEKSGDFDVQVEVVRWDRSLDTASYGHAGLQVRPSIYLPGFENTVEGTQVPNVMNTTYAEGNQERSALTIWRDAENGGYGNGPVIGTGTADSNGVIGRFGRLRAGDSVGTPIEGSSPDASRWLRLARSGDEFISYWSYDGVEWTEHNRHTLALPADVLVGFAGMTDTNGKQPWHYNTIHIRNFGDVGSTPAEDIVLTVSLSEGTLTLTWDGTGPFTVQKTTDPGSNSWEDVETTDQNSTTVSADGTMEFFRIVK